MDWWKINSIRFPVLSIMAKDYLAVMASSAPIERQFSIFGNIVTKNRNRMEKEIGRKIMCLRSWKVPEISVSESDSEAIEESDSEGEGIF